MDLFIKNYYEYNKKTKHPVKAVCLLYDDHTGNTSRGVARANRDWGDQFFKRHGRQLAKGRALEALQKGEDIYNKNGFLEGEFDPVLSEKERKILFPLEWDAVKVTPEKWEEWTTPEDGKVTVADLPPATIVTLERPCKLYDECPYQKCIGEGAVCWGRTCADYEPEEEFVFIQPPGTDDHWNMIDCDINVVNEAGEVTQEKFSELNKEEQ